MVFELNRDGGAEVLKQLAAETIRAYAAQIAEAANPGAKDSELATITERVGKKRFYASVIVPAERQAKLGVLSRAAIESGLEFRPTKPRSPRKPKKKKKPSA